jgi:hypothetical protein
LSILLGFTADGVLDGGESCFGLDVGGLDLEGGFVGVKGSDCEVLEM